MFSGAVVWNITKNIAIRINRIEYFSTNIVMGFATLSAHYLASDGSVREIVIVSEKKEGIEELQEFAERCQEIFDKNIRELMDYQVRDEISTKRAPSNLSENMIDWITKR